MKLDPLNHHQFFKESSIFFFFNFETGMVLLAHSFPPSIVLWGIFLAHATHSDHQKTAFQRKREREREKAQQVLLTRDHANHIIPVTQFTEKVTFSKLSFRLISRSHATGINAISLLPLLEEKNKRLGSLCVFPLKAPK